MKFMGINAKDTDVFQLLKNIKEATGIYPQELLAVRRQGYLKQVAEVSAGVGLATALKNTVKSTQGTGAGASLPPAASALLESVLVAAIIIEAGAVTYFYRDKFVDLYNTMTNSPKVEEISLPPVISSPIADLQFTVTPVSTMAVTETPISTPTSTLLADLPTHQDSESDSGDTDQESTQQNGSTVISTPNPNGNNGNQYGHTPIPARTKEPGNNSNRDNAQETQTRPNKRP